MEETWEETTTDHLGHALKAVAATLAGILYAAVLAILLALPFLLRAGCVALTVYAVASTLPVLVQVFGSDLPAWLPASALTLAPIMALLASTGRSEDWLTSLFANTGDHLDTPSATRCKSQGRWSVIAGEVWGRLLVSGLIILTLRAVALRLSHLTLTLGIVGLLAVVVFSLWN